MPDGLRHINWNADWNDVITQLKPFYAKKENRLYAAQNSFKHFIIIYMSHFITIKPAEFHLESWDKALIKRNLELWPRGFGKSVIWSVCYPLWKMLCNPDKLDLRWEKQDIFCISKTQTLVEKWVRWQKRELMENARIIGDFNPVKGEMWRNDEYELKGKGRVRAIGVEGQFRGEHPTDAILDDIEDRKEAKSESNRESLREWFYGDFLGAMRLEKNKDVGVKIIGNCVHPLGLMQELFALDWWESTKYSVYKEDKVTPIWEEYMDAEAIEDLRSKIPEATFMAEYMNEPVVSENPTFIRKHFNAYEAGMLRARDNTKLSINDMFKVTSLDPAISTKDGSDYSALTTWGVTFEEHPKIFCLEAKRGHWSAPRQITEMLAAYEKFPGSTQVIETVGGFEAIYQEYKERLDRERLNIRVIDVKPNKDKGIRANAIVHLFEQGWVYFDHSDRMQQLLMDELALFDFSVRKHGRDDFVDSTTQALNYIDTWLRRKRKKEKRDNKLQLLWSPHSRLYREAANG